MSVWQEVQITETGVGPVWLWECPECPDMYGETLFWENSIRSVNNHIRYHHARERLSD